MRQVLCGGNSSNPSATRYNYVDGWNITTNVQVYAQNLVAEAGTINNLRVDLITAPGVGTGRGFTLMKNGVATACEVIIVDAATTGEDTTHSVSVAAGDKISIRQFVAGSPAGTAAYWACDFVATASQRAIWGTTNNSDVATVSATRYGALGGTGVDCFSRTTAAAAGVPWAINATIKSFYVFLGVPPTGATKSWTISIFKNGSIEASSTLVLTDTTDAANVTGLNIAVAPHDLLSVEVVPANSPSFTHIQYGVSYEPTVDGQWNMSGATLGGTNPTDGHFMPVIEGRDEWDATETTRLIGADAGGSDSVDWNIDSFYFVSDVAPAGAETRTLTLRKSGSDSLQVVLTGAATSGTSGSSETCETGSYLAVRSNQSGGAASAAKLAWAMACGEPTPGGASAGSSNLLLLGVG